MAGVVQSRQLNRQVGSSEEITIYTMNYRMNF